MSEIKVPSNGNLISFGVELYKVFVKKLKKSFDRWDAAANAVEKMHRRVEIGCEFPTGPNSIDCTPDVTDDVINGINMGDRLAFVGSDSMGDDFAYLLESECVVTNLRGGDGSTKKEVEFVFTDADGNLWSGRLGKMSNYGRATVTMHRASGEHMMIPGYELSNSYEFSPLVSVNNLLPLLSVGMVVRFVRVDGKDLENENLAGEHVILSVQKGNDGAVVSAIFVVLGVDNVLLWTIAESGVTGHTLLPL